MTDASQAPAATAPAGTAPTWPTEPTEPTGLAEIHERSLKELEDGLSPELQDKLRRITLPLSDTDDAPPTESELRIAQAQLVGWLEGLFHGIQTVIAAGVIIGEDGEPVRQAPGSPKLRDTQEKHDGDAPSTGQYL